MVSAECMKFERECARLTGQNIEIRLPSPIQFPAFVARQQPKYHYGSIAFAKVCHILSRVLIVITQPALFDIMDLYGPENLGQKESTSRVFFANPPTFIDESERGVNLLLDRLSQLKSRFPQIPRIAEVIALSFAVPTAELVALSYRRFFERPFDSTDYTLACVRGEAFRAGVRRTFARCISRFQKYTNVCRVDPHPVCVPDGEVTIPYEPLRLVGGQLPYRYDMKIGSANCAVTYMAIYTCNDLGIAATRNFIGLLTGTQIQRYVLDQIQSHEDEIAQVKDGGDTLFGAEGELRRLEIQWPSEMINVDNALEALISAGCITRHGSRYYVSGRAPTIGGIGRSFGEYEVRNECLEDLDEISEMNATLQKQLHDL